MAGPPTKLSLKSLTRSLFFLLNRKNVSSSLRVWKAIRSAIPGAKNMDIGYLEINKLNNNDFIVMFKIIGVEAV